jgi:hypothetical protein
MAGTETTGKTAVFEGTIKVKSRILATGVVTDPGLSRVDVRGIGMIGLVVKMTDLRSRLGWAYLPCAWRSWACLWWAWLGYAWRNWVWRSAKRRRPVRRWSGRDETSSSGFTSASALLRDGQRARQPT